MRNAVFGQSERLQPRIRRETASKTEASVLDSRAAVRVESKNTLWLAAWFGVLTGLLELLQLSVRNQLNGSVWLGVLRMNRNYGWMIPAANVFLFLAAGLLVTILARFAPRVAAWLSIRLPATMAALALLLTVRGLHPIASVSVAAAIGHRLARRLDLNGRALSRWVRTSLPVLLLIELVLAGACSLPLVGPARETRALAATPGHSQRPNVLLIVLDTVRAANLSLHGYDRLTSPNLERLARGGVHFEQARTTAPWTFPAHASLFTGRWPHELKVGESRPLDSTYPTLAEHLGAQGYRTAGFVANTFFCNSWYGLGRGFDRYEDFYDDDVAISVSETLHSSTLGQLALGVIGISTIDHRVRKDAARINADFLDWLTGSDSRPFFAFLNYFDAHSPYLLPSGHSRKLGTREPTPEELRVLQTWEDRPKQGIAQAEVQLIRDAYDECVADLDDQLGRLFDELDRRGVLQNTLVIVTSDHGEQLGEHELFGHGKSLYRQETHVPLLIVPPQGTPTRLNVSDPVSLRDMPATIADVAGTSDGGPFPGRSLAAYWRSQSVTEPLPASPAFSEVALRLGVSRNPARPPAWRGPMQALVVKDRAYIRNADGSEELHDVVSDPREVRDIAGDVNEGPVLARMRDILREVRFPAAAQPDSIVNRRAR